MAETGEPTPPRAGRAALMSTGVFVGAALVLAGWAAFGAYKLFGFELGRAGRLGSDGSEDRTVFYLVLAMGFTVVGTLVAAVSARRTLGLVRRGVEVPGVVTSDGWVVVNGMVNVKIEYVVEGQTYTMKTSALKSQARQYQAEPGVTLIVDPDRPGRCMLKD